MSGLQLTPPDTRRVQTVSLVVGLAGLALAIVFGIGHPRGFFESYLLAFLFWLGLSLGSLVLLFIQHLAGGSWGALIARQLEAGAASLPVMALLFVPLLFGLHHVYVWTDAGYVAEHASVAAKTGYLNVPFFIVRAAIYFLIWAAAALLYRRLSQRQDADAAHSGRLGYRMKNMAGVFVVIYILTMTLAGIDWAMSLTPTWWSGIYSVILMASQAITALALIIVTSVSLANRNDSIDRLLTPKRLQDLGNLLMAITMFWAYTQVSQLIIQWSNNVVETNTWYVLRFDPQWIGLSAFLLFFGFFAPFGILFSRWVKRKRRALRVMAVWSFLAQLVNLFWFVVPTFGRSGAQVTWLDLFLLVGVGGVWVALFARSLASRNVLPANDPRLLRAVGEHHA